jgi:DNA-binding transcriptional regulator YhcF (GntR family)
MHATAASSRVLMNGGEILERLRSHVVGRIHREALRTGDRLPSMRELADQWGVHARFVRAAYETLQREGLVELRPRSGVYVGGSPAGVIAGDPEIGNWLVEALIRGRAWGVPPVEWPERMSRYLRTQRLRAACVESNDDQISWLVHESRLDYGLDGFAVDLDSLDEAELARRIRAADMVISTAFHGEMLESVARAERKPIVLLRLAGNFVESVMAALRRDRLYFVVGDRRFALRLPIIYGGVEGGRNLHPLVAGEDDLGVIPPGAAVYVTRAAEIRVNGAAELRTVWSPGRIFADSMATDLLRIIVGYNIAAMRHAISGPAELEVS